MIRIFGGKNNTYKVGIVGGLHGYKEITDGNYKKYELIISDCYDELLTKNKWS